MQLYTERVLALCLQGFGWGHEGHRIVSSKDRHVEFRMVLLHVLCSVLLAQPGNTSNPVPKITNPNAENCKRALRTAGITTTYPRGTKHAVYDRRHPQEFSTESSEVNMADGMQKDWRELCLAVTNESDSTKLTCLVQELIEALDRGEQSWQHPIPPSDPIAASRETA